MELRLLVLKDKNGVKSEPVLQHRRALNVKINGHWGSTKWENVPIVEEDGKNEN